MKRRHLTHRAAGMFCAALACVLTCLLPTAADAKSTPELIHYWSFNEMRVLLQPTQSIGGAELEISPGPLTEMMTGLGNGFEAENARLGEEAGAHLRVNNPLDASLILHLPTHSHEAVVLSYEARRSGQGPGTLHVSYSTDGSAFTPLESVTLLNDAPQVFIHDFSELPGTSENTAFAVRLEAEQGEGGEEGNMRLDNIVLEGALIPGAQLPPQVAAPPASQQLREDGEAFALNLQDIFESPSGAALSFEASVDRPHVLEAAISGSTLTITPQVRGDAIVTLSASDGQFPAVEARLRVLVHPAPHALAAGAFNFGHWDSDAPEHSFPEHMLFLQSRETDPGLDAALSEAYFVPHLDYAQEDADTIGFPHNNTARTRLNGLGADGISFINTGRGRDLGGALLALDTRELTRAEVSWLGATILQNSRQYGIRLQFRTGHSGPWQDVLSEGAPVEYRSQSDGLSRQFTGIALPAAALGQPYVQLLWRYHHLEGEEGPRSELRLDDVTVTPAVDESAEVLPLNEIAARLRDNFDEVDTNNDNRLSLAEINTWLALNNIQPISQTQFNLLDDNSDGSLTRAEIQRYLEPPPPPGGCRGFGDKSDGGILGVLALLLLAWERLRALLAGSTSEDA